MPAAPPSVAPGAPEAAGPVPSKGKRPSKKLIIIGSAVALVVIAAIVAVLIVTNIIRGGTKSPEAAGEKLIESINEKDVIGLVTLIAPHERDAAMRVQSAVMDKVKEYGIVEALKKISPEAALNDDNALVLDGVEVTVSGAAPVVTEISAEFAQVRFTSGEVRTSINPSETKGALRSIFDASEQTDVLESNFLVADMGPGQSGLTLIATKSDGRWYLSPMLSTLEFAKAIAEQDSGFVNRGTVPDKFPKGSDSVEAAAEAGVRNAVVALNESEPVVLAPYLVKAEAAAFYMYADLWKIDDAGGSASKAALGDVSFAKGASEGDRAQAIVQNLSTSGDGNKVFIDESCISGSAGDKKCLNGSGYALNNAAPGVNPMALFTLDGKYGITTVKEDGGWKVSVLDTVADMAVSWVDSLSKEQALALLQLAQTDKPGGALSWEQATTLDYNSAGYAVRTLNVDKAQIVAFKSEGRDTRVKVFTKDLKTEIRSDYQMGGANFALEPGDYVTVHFASGVWAEKFAAEGNKVKHSGSVTLARGQ